MGRRRRRRGYRTKNKNPTRQCVEKTYIYIYGSIYHRIESNSNMNLIAIIGIDKELGSEKPNGRR